jgi:hypothetical protein
MEPNKFKVGNQHNDCGKASELLTEAEQYRFRTVTIFLEMTNSLESRLNTGHAIMTDYTG